MNNTEEQLPYEVFSIFPMPIYKANIGREFTKQEQDEFDAIISEMSEHPEAKTPKIYKRLSPDKYLLNGTRKPFLAIQSFIEHHLKEFSTTIMGIKGNELSCEITQSWLNVFEPTAFNIIHHHRNSIISGVFYINCLELPDNKTDGINFASDRHEMFQEIELPITQNTMFSAKAHYVPVVTGDLILFPSSINHSVNLNETSDQTRISLAFNTFLFGVLGKYEDTSELILKQEK